MTNDTITLTPAENTSDEVWRYGIAFGFLLLFVCGMVFLFWYLMKTRNESKLTYLDIDEANESSKQLAP